MAKEPKDMENTATIFPLKAIKAREDNKAKCGRRDEIKKRVKTFLFLLHDTSTRRESTRLTQP